MDTENFAHRLLAIVMKSPTLRALVFAASAGLSVLALRIIFWVGGALLASFWVFLGLMIMAAVIGAFPAEIIRLARKAKSLMTEVK